MPKVCVDVRPSRLLIAGGNGVIGTQNDKNTVAFKFSFPLRIADTATTEYEKKARLSNSINEVDVEIDNNGRMIVPQEMLTDSFLDVTVILKNQSKTWKTSPRRFHLRQTRKSDKEINVDAFTSQLILAINANIVKIDDDSSPQEIISAISATNWQDFKSEIIAILNSHFAADLPESADAEEISAAISNSFVELIQAFNEKFNLNIDSEADVSDMLSALNNVEDVKSIIQLMNDTLPFNVLNPRNPLFYIDPDNFTTPTVRTALRDYHTFLQDYMSFFQFTINTINNYREADEKYDTQNMTIPQGTTAIWGITYLIDDLIYWRDLYKGRWEDAVNALKTEEEKIDFDSLSFDSAEDLEIQLDEISTDFSAELDRLTELEAEKAELEAENATMEAEKQAIINDLYAYYTGTGRFAKSDSEEQ